MALINDKITALAGGALAFFALLGLYFGVLTLASGWSFTLSQFAEFWPYLAGYLTPIGIGLPFLGSGILMALSGLMLLALRLDDLVAAESHVIPAKQPVAAVSVEAAE